MATAPDPITPAVADLPVIDFDEGVAAVVARTRIAGEWFDVPPMPAEAIRYFQEIKDLRTDDPKVDGLALLREFICKCLLPEDRERAQAALERSPMTLVQLMQKGGDLIRTATGFPTSPPWPLDALSSNGSAGTTGDTLPAPASPRSSASRPGRSST